MQTNNDFNIFLQDIWSVNLALLGMTLTIFTVLYSFIIVKRDELKITANKIKSGDKSIETKLSNKNLSKYIVDLKAINSTIVRAIIICFSIFLLSWSVHRLIPVEYACIKRGATIILGSFTIGEIGYLIFSFTKILNHYKSTTKI